MRTALSVGCVFLLWHAALRTAADPPKTSRKAESDIPSARKALDEACEIVLKQDEHQRYWCERALLQLGNIQIRAGDFDSALRSIRGSSYDYGRNEGFAKVAEALARAGHREHAYSVLRLADRVWRREYWDDGVQLQWIEHLIASGDLEGAHKAIGQLKAEGSHADGLRRLAVAYAESGDGARAAQIFALAVATAANLKDEFSRARAMWETADAQLTVVSADAANATIRRLVETIEFKDPWAKVSALRESAVLAARAKDEQTARRLFRRAIEAQAEVNALNKIGALQAIAIAQARVGYLGDARKTAAMIEHSEDDFTQDGRREEALFAIAMAQLRANDVEGAVRTALSVEYYVQYRDDALHEVVAHQITRRDLKSALAAAEKVENPSRRAAAILKVATAHAMFGDRKAAAGVASRIDLTARHEILVPKGQQRFDYRLPPTWGVSYDAHLAFTMASSRAADRRAAEVAAAAMTLAQALGQQPDRSYAVLFNEVHIEEVVQSLARAHAASGNASEALAWARKIGSDAKLRSDESLETHWAVGRRVHALMGVAEGILDRSGKKSPVGQR